MNCPIKTSLAMLLAALLISPLAAAEKKAKPIDLLADNLAAWQFYSAGDGTKMGDVWSLEDGVLKCKGTPLGYIHTKKDYKDFVLRLEWRWPPKQTPGKGASL